MKISMILAATPSGLIGRHGQLPWGRIPRDLAFFKVMTLGHVVIGGRNTLNSVGPLRDRRPILVSRSLSSRPDVASDPEEALFIARDRYPQRNIFFIGGAEIYRTCVRYCHEVLLTTVHGFEAGESQKGDVGVDLGNLLKDFSCSRPVACWGPDESCPYSLVIRQFSRKPPEEVNFT